MSTQPLTSANTQSYHSYTYKYVVIGEGGCGKTSLTSRLVNSSFDPTYQTTIGVEFESKTIQVANKRIKLHIWDTAGQEMFRTITRSYYRSAVGALLVFDLTRRKTYNSLDYWLAEIDQNSSIKREHVILIGNKQDLEHRRQVSTEEAIEYCRVRGLNSYLETSAKTGHLIKNAFNKLSQDIYQVYNDDYFKNTPEVPGIVNLTAHHNAQRKQRFWERWCSWG